MKQKFIGCNWKMNGGIKVNHNLLTKMKEQIHPNKGIEVVVFPPFIYINDVREILKDSNIKYGSQNISHYEEGAYTGEVSSRMLDESGCKYSIIGHSERRIFFNETNEDIKKKISLSKKYNITPIICIGESYSEKKLNFTKQVIEKQLFDLFDNNSIDLLYNSIIAYEPVWAIGKKSVEIQFKYIDNVINNFIIKEIKKYSEELLKSIRIIYGGSVSSGNIHKIVNELPYIDGVLVGGASLIHKEIIGIYKKINNK